MVAFFACTAMTADAGPSPLTPRARRLIAPTAQYAAAERAALATTSSPDLEVDAVKYYGGPVISAVKVIQVSWGPSVNAQVQAGLTSFYRDVLPSDYLKWLDGDYNTTPANPLVASSGTPGTNQHIGTGTFGGQFTITPANTQTNITDSAIALELVHQFDIGALPKPEYDAAGNTTTLYMTDFPPGVSIAFDGGSSCTTFCGYHNAYSYNGKPFLYGVHPDIASGGCESGGCGTEGIVGNAEAIHSHELVEAITDTAADNTLAWYDQGMGRLNGEVGDICNQRTATYANHIVQSIWSNLNGGCIVARPVCDSLTSPTNAPCRACNAGDDNQPYGCSGAKAHCATSATDPNHGLCVACITNAHCYNPIPICENDACRGCKSASDCPSTAPLCDPSGACFQCTASDTSRCTGATPLCDTAAGKCVACLSNADCKGGTPICDRGTATCRACAGDTDCTMGVCDTANDADRGKCVQCNGDAQCKSPAKCDTATHVCAACTATSGCSNPKPVCDTGSTTCRGCTTDAECASSPAGHACETQGANAGACVACASTDPSCAAKCDGGACADGGASTGGGGGGGCAIARAPAGLTGAGAPLAILLGLAAGAARRRRRRR